MMWIKEPYGGRFRTAYWRYRCPECNNWQTYGETPYCPFCGAKMDDERKKDNA